MTSHYRHQCFFGVFWSYVEYTEIIFVIYFTKNVSRIIFFFLFTFDFFSMKPDLYNELVYVKIVPG